MSAPTAKELALSYLDQGWAVVPVKEATKHPCIKNWSESYFTGVAQVEDWWSVNPKHGVGIVTGSPSGLLGLDVDPRHGGDISVRQMETEHGPLPRSLEVQTGGGGCHLLFRHPGRSVRNRAGIRPGLDLRADGGFLVAPPSIHPTGQRYEWLVGPGQGELADPPDWLMRELEQPASPIALTPGSDAVPEDHRHDWLMRRAGGLRHSGLSEGAVLDTLVFMNERFCKPPIDDIDELKDMASYVGARPIGSNDYATTYGGLVVVEKKLVWRTAEDLLVEELQPSWVFEGYVAREAVTLLAAKPKVGKTTFLAQLIRSVVKGDPFLNRRTERTRVMYLTEERWPTFGPKMSRNGFGDQVVVLTRSAAKGLSWSSIIGSAVTKAQEEGAGLLVVDTFTPWTGLDGEAENAAGSVIAAMGPLHEAAASGLAVVVVHHLRKGSGNGGDAVRGSSALTGEVDVIAELHVDGQDDGTRRRLTAKGRFEDTPGMLLLDFRRGDYFLVGEGASAGKDADMQELLAFMSDKGPMTASEVAQARGEGETTIRRRLDALQASGGLKTKGSGKKGDPRRYWT